MTDGAVRQALRTFEATHDLVATGLTVQWELRGLPGPGTWAEQDSWTLDAIRHIRQVANTMVAEQKASTRHGRQRS